MAWRSGNYKPFKKIVKVVQCSCERCCARLAGAVKSNSSGIEVWRGSRYLFLRKRILDRAENQKLESTSMCIRGDWQVTETTG
jgi:hypothetical protein